ncbi:MAG: hypothetical protein R2784_18725 [Saprospiraceae bacterium]
MRSIFNIFILFISIFVFSCDSGPKVIQANETAPPMSGDGAMTNPHNHAMTGTGAEETHKVVAKEVMDTDKYSYIRVDEDGNEFWIAISKRDIKIGDTYYYKGGLLKKNFYSREFDKEFETVYLVSNLSQQPAGAPGSGSAVDQALNKINGGPSEAADLSVDDIQPAAGSVPISDLLKNKTQYAGKSVKVPRKVVKINPMSYGQKLGALDRCQCRGSGPYHHYSGTCSGWSHCFFRGQLL